MSLLKKTMITSGLVGCMMLSFSGSAIASDTDWNGLYGGAIASYGSGEIDGIGALAGIDKQDTMSGINYGILAGWNYQSDDWVFGLEGDFSGSSVDGDVDVLGVAVTEDLKWVGNIRARAGILTQGGSLFYGTAGVAFTNIDILTDSLTAGNDSSGFTGWTAGGGFEASLFKNARGRIEYSYSDYGTENMFQSVGGVDVSAYQHTVRVGVIFPFGK